MRDEHGTPVPGYGWMFPAGDGTVNIGVGALSTMKGFKKLNLNTLLDQYAAIVREPWSLGPYLEKPRAWRLPMSCRPSPRAGLGRHRRRRRLRQPDERRRHRLRPGERHAGRRQVPRRPGHGVRQRTTALVGERFDGFLRTGRRFSFLIGHPWLLRAGLRIAVGTQAAADITLAVMGNLVDNETPGMAGRVLRLGDRVLGVADPLLRRTRASG